MKHRTLHAIAFAVTFSLAYAAAAQPASTGSGQAYPTRPIRFNFPTPPAGGADTVARLPMSPRVLTEVRRFRIP
jgi:tripartite-type tricarboxylate transporter receptor subunit TctC